MNPTSTHQATGFLPLMMPQRTVVVPGKWYPRLSIDLEWRPEGWYAAMTCTEDRGGCECFRGPYHSRQAAERNAACYGRDFLRARGLTRMWEAMTRYYRLPTPNDRDRPRLPVR